MIRVTGEDRIKLLATMAVEIFKALAGRVGEADQATKAVDIAYKILDDTTNRVNGQ